MRDDASHTEPEQEDPMGDKTAAVKPRRSDNRKNDVYIRGADPHAIAFAKKAARVRAMANLAIYFNALTRLHRDLLDGTSARDALAKHGLGPVTD